MEAVASLAVLAAAAALAIARLILDHTWVTAHPEYFRADLNVPLLFNYDGWWFLRLAGESLQSGRLWDVPALPALPALSVLLAAAAKALGQPLEAVAFWAPPLLALLLLPVVFLWGRRLAGSLAGACAVLATACSPFWAQATGPGMLDTKCLIPPLLTLSALALSGFACCGRSRAVVHLSLFALIAAMAVWWWKPSVGFCLLSLGAAFAARAATSKAARAAVLILGLAGAAGLILIMTGAHEALPPLPRDVLRYAERHIALVFRTDPASAAMADSIIELAPASFAELSRLSAGSVPAMLAALAGLCLAFLTRPREAAPLASPVLALGMALSSHRMILIFAPAMGIGFGVFVATAAGLCRRDALCGQGLPSRRGLPAAFGKRPLVRACLALALAAAVLAPAFQKFLSQRPSPPFTLKQDELALAVRRAVLPGTVIWTWWDYGYFLQERTGLPTFFDGGSQTEDDCFVAAFPLASSDPVLAANWMRFFARAGQGEFGRIAARVGSREKALDLLVRLFRGQEDQKPILGELSALSEDQAQSRFFPEVNVCLVLPRRFFDISGYWMAYAVLPGAKRPGPLNHIDVLASRGLEVEPAEGRLRLPDSALAKGYDFVPSVVELGGEWNSAPLYDESLAEPILFFRKGSPLAYITDKAGARSLAFWLLAPTGFDCPLFRTVGYDPETGGAWLVGKPGPSVASSK